MPEEDFEETEPVDMDIRGAELQAARTRLETLALMRKSALLGAIATIGNEVERLTKFEATMYWPSDFPIRPMDPKEWQLAFKQDGLGRIRVIFHWDPIQFERTRSSLDALKIDDGKGNGLAQEDFTPMNIGKIHSQLNELTECHNQYIAERNKTHLPR